MVLFGFKKIDQRTYFRHYGLIKIFLKFPNRLFRDLLLGRVVIKYNRSVLGTHIGTLSVEGGRVMSAHENQKQVPKTNHGRVKEDAHYFRMACTAGTYFPVGGFAGHISTD